ncbi:hypothetical protein [Cryptosporangium sp. NPDC051539]|uniref:hypothetical protein n=1 Tax=Cryptosporangium sp. NPDC051539 TaxID=3363962 RepID=UPI0037B71919
MSYDQYHDQSPGSSYEQQWVGPPSYAVSPAGPLPEAVYAPPPLPPPVPPPANRPNTALVVLVTVIVTLLATALVVCGLGTFGVVLIGASADSSSSPTPTPKPSKTASAAPSSTAELIQPAGAPYSYRLPTGFHTQPATEGTSGSPSATPDPDLLDEYYDTYSAPQGGSVYDFLFVASFPLKGDTGDAALTATLDKYVAKIGQDASTRAAVKVGKYSAYKYSFADAAKGAWDYFVYDGRTVVDVTCSWSSDQAGIQRGCLELLDTLTVTG